MKVLRAAAEATAAAAAAAVTPPHPSTKELSEAVADAQGDSPNEIIDLSRKDATTDLNRNDIKHVMGGRD